MKKILSAIIAVTILAGLFALPVSVSAAMVYDQRFDAANLTKDTDITMSSSSADGLGFEAEMSSAAPPAHKWMVLTPSNPNYPNGLTGNVMRIQSAAGNGVYNGGGAARFYFNSTNIAAPETLVLEIRLYWNGSKTVRFGFSPMQSSIIIDASGKVRYYNGNSNDVADTGTTLSGAGWYQFKIVNPCNVNDGNKRNIPEGYLWNGTEYQRFANFGTCYSDAGLNKIFIDPGSAASPNIMFIHWIKVYTLSNIPLDTPESPAGDGANLSWNAVPEAASYEVTLYKGGNVLHTYPGVTETSLYTAEAVYDTLRNGAGAYTATVKANSADPIVNADSAASPASEVFTIEDPYQYIRLRDAVDFEDKAAGTALSTGGVVVSQADTTAGASGNAMRLANNGSETVLNGLTYYPAGTTADTAVFKAEVYVPDASSVSVYGGGTGVSFNNGLFRYFSGGNATAFEPAVPYTAGWHTVEITLQKSTPGAAGYYTSARFALDGNALTAQEGATMRYSNNAALKDNTISFWTTNNANVFFDNIEIYDFSGETRAKLAPPANAALSAEGILTFTPAAQGTHTAQLYRGGKLFSTKTLAPSVTSADFSADMTRGGTALYTATVRAKGNLSSTVGSDAV
ncbi:MAG: hypothetical protein LBH54_04255, partial [Clostridiales bacterium]|nr:hypothetical protein [Clostridiales bacterium]